MVPLSIFLKYAIYLRLCNSKLPANGKYSYGFMRVVSIPQAHCLPILPLNSLNESLVNLEVHCFLVSLLIQVFPTRFLILKERLPRKLAS